MTQVPLYFYGLLLALGWNEIVAVLRNPVYFIFLILLAVGAYVTYTLNLWGPMLKMTNAASQQAIEEGKRRLRDFLDENPTARQAAVAMTGREEFEMSNLSRTPRSTQKVKTDGADDDDDEDEM
ncbi:Dynamin-like GTPase that mediates homotypic ER fusion [Exophiala xenobiotica]|nr:Dynamin-like GTPase that mediates homotypic ER fusion [Exophiala xenobiotica]